MLFEGILITVGLAAFVGGFRGYRRYRLVADTPTSKASSMAVGPVELKGDAVPAPGAHASTTPVTRTPCLYWECVVEERRTRTVGSGKNRRTESYWATVDRAESRARIGVDDGSGVAVVDPQKGPVPAPEQTRFDSGFLRDPSPAMAEYLRARGLDHESWFGLNKTMRVTERSLAPGTRLYVLGTAVRDAGAGAHAAGNDALVVQPEGRVPFVLSAGDEKAVVRGSLAQFWIGLGGGIALVAFGTWLLTRSVGA